jgi:hypothetical protein
LNSYHSIQDFDVHNNLETDFMMSCGSGMTTKAERKSEAVAFLCVI